MGQINPDNLPFNFIYITDDQDQALLTNDDGSALLIAGTVPFPPRPPFNGSNGNQLLCTSYIVDMGFPRLPLGAQDRSEPNGPTRDRKGRPVRFD